VKNVFGKIIGHRHAEPPDCRSRHFVVVRGFFSMTSSVAKQGPTGTTGGALETDTARVDDARPINKPIELDVRVAAYNRQLSNVRYHRPNLVVGGVAPYGICIASRRDGDEQDLTQPNHR
jgi:hypothetical protein